MHAARVRYHLSCHVYRHCPRFLQSAREAARCTSLQQRCSAVQEHMLHGLSEGTLPSPSSLGRPAAQPMSV
jgi:hypothetical protein